MSNPKTVEIYDEEKKELNVIDVSEKHLEKVARGYILGTTKFSNQRELRQKLESKVEKKIGAKGKFLVEKLFELIEGVHIVDGRSGKDGKTVRYYQQPPNLQAIIYALDRVLGKPKAVTEHTETKQGIVLVEHIIKGMVADPKRNYAASNGTGKNVLGAGSGGGGFKGEQEAGVNSGEGNNIRVSEAVVSR